MADFPQFLARLGPQLHPLGEFRLPVPLDTCPTPAMIFYSLLALGRSTHSVFPILSVLV